MPTPPSPRRICHWESVLTTRKVYLWYLGRMILITGTNLLLLGILRSGAFTHQAFCPTNMNLWHYNKGYCETLLFWFGTRMTSKNIPKLELFLWNLDTTRDRLMLRKTCFIEWNIPEKTKSYKEGHFEKYFQAVPNPFDCWGSRTNQNYPMRLKILGYFSENPRV